MIQIVCDVAPECGDLRLVFRACFASAQSRRRARRRTAVRQTFFCRRLTQSRVWRKRQTFKRHKLCLSVGANRREGDRFAALDSHDSALMNMNLHPVSDDIRRTPSSDFDDLTTPRRAGADTSRWW